MPSIFTTPPLSLTRFQWSLNTGTKCLRPLTTSQLSAKSPSSASPANTTTTTRSNLTLLNAKSKSYSTATFPTISANGQILARSFSTQVGNDDARFNKTEFYKPDSGKPKLVLAYSGGLDTSCQLSYLVNERGFEVCAYIADLGQSDLDSQKKRDDIKNKAKLSGAYAFYCEDLKHQFINEFVYPLISSNAIYEGRYLLGTSIARPCIGKRQVEIAWEEKAEYISHGSTGKGNDQVRFELCYLCLDPTLKPVTLWRDPAYCKQFAGRQALLDYASQHNIPVTQTKKESYSEDENMMHISFESGELEEPSYPGKLGHGNYPGKVLRKKTNEKGIANAPNESEILKIDFEQGIPKTVINVSDHNKKVTGSVELFEYLNQVAGKHAVGRIDIVENRFVGMKSRGCYETPAGTVLFSAHHDLELLTLDREVMRIRDSLTQKYADLVYNGYWFSPEMGFLKKIMLEAQKSVTGSAYLELFKGNVYNIGRESKYSLYDTKLVSMDEHGEYDPTQATGFIKTLATRLRRSKLRDDNMGSTW